MSHTNPTLFDREHSHRDEEQVTFRLVMREDPVSDELKAATIAGMKQRLKAKKQREARRKMITRRVVAAAAVVLVLLCITPLGGYVTSAAESFFSSVSEWMNSVFKISRSRVDADQEERFKIDITEAMLVNDSLCISLKTNNDLLQLSAEGRIYDEEGHSVPLYATPRKAGVIGGLLDDNGGNNGWRMYAPDLYDVIKSPDGSYRCSLTVTARLETDDACFSDRTEKKSFDFPLENVDNLFKAKRYKIGKKIKNNGVIFNFTELLVSENSQTVMGTVTCEDGHSFHAHDWFAAELTMPDVTDRKYGREDVFSGNFSLSDAYRISKTKYVIMCEFASNYQYYENNTDYYHFHEFEKPPYKIIIHSVTYNKVTEKQAYSEAKPIEYGKLPEIYLPIAYNQRGEIETTYQNISFPVTDNISIRLNGIEKNRTGRYGYEFADKKPDYKLSFTVDQGEMMSVMSDQYGKHIDVMDGINATTQSGMFPVVFSAMSKGREVFRMRCKMDFGDYNDITLREDGHYVHNGIIWLERPYEEYLMTNEFGETPGVFNIIADNMNALKNASGEYPSLGAVFKKFDIDTLRLVSVGLYINYYEDTEHAVVDEWAKTITLADPAYYNFSRLPEQTGGSYTSAEQERKTVKVNLTVTATEQP